MAAFRVMQFNMQFGQIWDEADPQHAPIRLEETLREIRRQEPDLLFLQEVEHAASPDVYRLTPHYNCLRQELAGYHSVFSLPDPDPRELPFGIGLAIFSRTPLTDFNRVVLPSPLIPFEFEGRSTMPTDRLLIGARTIIAGHELALFNVHLLAYFMLRSSSSQYPQQRQTVVRVVAEQTLPTILAGDFNVSDPAPLVQQLAEVGFVEPPSRQPTWRHRPYVLDHIFTNSGLRCVSHRVVPTPASDHHVVVAELEMVGRDGIGLLPASSVHR